MIGKDGYFAIFKIALFLAIIIYIYLKLENRVGGRTTSWIDPKSECRIMQGNSLDMPSSNLNNSMPPVKPPKEEGYNPPPGWHLGIRPTIPPIPEGCYDIKSMFCYYENIRPLPSLSKIKCPNCSAIKVAGTECEYCKTYA